MSVTIKSEHELEKMREAGRILGIVHDEMAKIIRPGISTMAVSYTHLTLPTTPYV